MKTIATVIASVLLSLGMLTAPAHADGETPPASCDEMVADWKARALGAEARESLLWERLVYSNTVRSGLGLQIEALYVQVDSARADLAKAQAKLVRRQTVFYRQARRIDRQAATISRLRDRLAASR